MKPFQSEALRGAAAEAWREGKPLRDALLNYARARYVTERVGAASPDPTKSLSRLFQLIWERQEDVSGEQIFDWCIELNLVDWQAEGNCLVLGELGDAALKLAKEIK